MKRLLAAILIVMNVTSAKAGPDSDLLAKAGVLGAWAANCSQPPSSENPYQLYAPSSTGYPTRVLKMDSKIDRTSELRNVRLLENNRVRFRMKASGEFDDRDITIVTTGNRHRSLEAADSKGKKYVTNGKFLSGGETPWFEKCAR